MMCDMDFDDWFPAIPLSLRAVQKDRTRARIIATAIELMRQGGEGVVTIRAAAAVAGVTERTIYRHFKGRDALLRSAWKRMAELVGAPPSPETADALVERPRNLFPRLDRERDLVRAYLHSEERGAGSTRTDEPRQRRIIGCVRDDLEYLDEPSLRRRAAIADLIASAYAWQYMQEFWGLTGEEAGEVAAEAIEILLNRRLAY